jgi:hypothetical protein
MEEYEALKEQQGNCCAICNKLAVDKPLQVDHDHQTNVVRGLLCFHCNILLGVAGDNKEVLLRAIDYLES